MHTDLLYKAKRWYDLIIGAEGGSTETSYVVCVSRTRVSEINSLI